MLCCVPIPGGRQHRAQLVAQQLLVFRNDAFHVAANVPGSVIGYNISNFGRFSGASYPLLVETEYGIAKCSMRELSPA